MRNVIVFVLIFCSFSVTAQKKGFGKLAGRIVDHDSREELAGVSITVEKTSLGNATTVDGRFVILKVPVGVYKVKITCIGYTALIINDVVIKSNITTTIDTSLSADEVQLHEVAVVAERPVVNKSITSSVMSFSSFSIPYTRGGRAWEIGRTAEGITLPKFNTEEYDKINENEFLESIQNPLSTFSIDVDVASYTNMRRFINDGMLPPPDAIRTEELINYFSYDYPEPTDGHPVSFSTELSAAPWNSEHQLLLIGLQGKNIETKHLPSSNLVFLLDVSGSMNEPNKLPLVKSAFRLLVHQLRPQDNVAVVVYAGSSGIVLPSTSGKEKEKIISCIDRLEAGGTTAGGEGIVLAYKVAKENFLPDGNNRVILATDGDFNVGLS
ncbi:MAG: von Willebrand factor type A domain-containing protein, partial [Bacteriovoracaceae bacterium]